MSNGPYSQVVNGLNPSFISFPINSFLTSSGTVPTSTDGYCLYQKIGNLVIIQFQYTFATVGTGNYQLTLPVPISSTYTKPQGIFQVRYAVSGSSATHTGAFSYSGTTTLNMTAQLTFGGIPGAFTSALPNTGLSAGDIVSGQVSYVTS
jgi:hypothetical protein